MNHPALIAANSSSLSAASSHSHLHPNTDCCSAANRRAVQNASSTFIKPSLRPATGKHIKYYPHFKSFPALRGQVTLSGRDVMNEPVVSNLRRLLVPGEAVRLRFRSDHRREVVQALGGRHAGVSRSRGPEEQRLQPLSGHVVGGGHHLRQVPRSRAFLPLSCLFTFMQK